MVNVNEPPLRLRLRALVGVACLSTMPPDSPPSFCSPDRPPRPAWLERALHDSSVLSPTPPKRRTCTSVRFLVGKRFCSEGVPIAAPTSCGFGERAEQIAAKTVSDVPIVGKEGAAAGARALAGIFVERTFCNAILSEQVELFIFACSSSEDLGCTVSSMISQTGVVAREKESDIAAESSAGPISTAAAEPCGCWSGFVVTGTLTTVGALICLGESPP